MRIKARSVVPVVLLSMTLSTVACGQMDQLLATPTAAATATLTATPTHTPTITPTPRPDLSGAILLLSDLPPGFEELSAAELGVSPSDLATEQFQPEVIFAFVNPRQFQTIFGFNFLLEDRLQRIQFDTAVSQPQLTLPVMVAAIGAENVREEQVLGGMEDIGELQIAMTMLANVEGVSLQTDILLFRRELIAAAIVSMVIEGQKPNISLHDLGLKLDQHIMETLEAIR